MRATTALPACTDVPLKNAATSATDVIIAARMCPVSARYTLVRLVSAEILGNYLLSSIITQSSGIPKFRSGKVFGFDFIGYYLLSSIIIFKDQGRSI